MKCLAPLGGKAISGCFRVSKVAENSSNFVLESECVAVVAAFDI